MLQRSPVSGRCVRPLVGLLGLALSQCSGSGGDGPLGTSRDEILGGALVASSSSPVLYLQSPEGSCTAILVAPNLAVTARHCVASTTGGNFSCTSAGDLINTGDGAGQIGSDNTPGSVTFYSSMRVTAGTGTSGNPDASGRQIVSTQTFTACRDDVAFVVLDHSIPGLVPAPIRIDRATQVGELVSVWGYGLTDHVEPLGLRIRDGVAVAGVGPDVASNNTQLAPVRSVRISPVTCLGDSGGPMISTATGAVVAVVSLGSQAAGSGPFCANNELANTTGPRLAAYHALAISAFQAAGASPISEDPAPDAASSSDSASASESAPEVASTPDAAPEQEADFTPDSAPAGEPLSGPIVYRARGASCGIALERRDAPGPLDAVTVALAWGAAIAGRRRR